MHTLPHWALYALVFVAINLLVVPGLFWATAAISKHLSGQQHTTRKLFVDYAYALVPMGLAAWIAFSLGFVMVNGSYALTVISDPFGWGWNLFGTAHTAWTPMGTSIIGFLQAGTLTAGLLFALHTAFKIARQHQTDSSLAFRAALPVAGFLLVVTFGFMALYMG
jgi:hypothetical protein